VLPIDPGTRRSRDGPGVVGVVLVDLPAGEDPHPRRQLLWHVQDLFPGGQHLLGQQVAEPAGAHSTAQVRSDHCPGMDGRDDRGSTRTRGPTPLWPLDEHEQLLGEVKVRSSSVQVSPGVKPVAAEDHAGVRRVWAKRNNDLGRLQNKAAYRLHSVLCDLVAGGIATKISADAAERLLETLSPSTALEAAKAELAVELIADVRHLDEQMAASKRRIAAAVKASGTTLTELYGVGPSAVPCVHLHAGRLPGVASPRGIGPAHLHR
jgi:hypothetical protein